MGACYLRAISVITLLLVMGNCGGVIQNTKSFYPDQIQSIRLRDGRLWLKENVRAETSGSYCYQDDTLNCLRNGRLFTWDASNEACRSLGKGWRVPTDQEWRLMVAAYGGVVEDSHDGGKEAYNALIDEGTSGLDLNFGGNREPDGSYKRRGAHGFYWTSTTSDSTEAWFYNIAKHAGIVNRHKGSKYRAASVRCIQEKSQ